MTPIQRLVVVAPGRPGPVLELPGSRFSSDRPFISGGERSLYELAVAGAVLGLEVELRGDINRPILEVVTSAAGASPSVGLEPRRPDGADLIVIPETADKDLLATVALSSARRVMMLLGPPGLCGWSFEPGWTVPDSMTIPLDTIGTAWNYRQLEGSGLTLWTHTHGIAETGHRSGVEVTWIGTGTPVPFPDGIAKQFDVAVVAANRWAGWAREVADRLEVASVLTVPATPSVYSLSPWLAPARILLWPSRVEGVSRIAREARGVGTVPIALDTNPFATVDDHGPGVVLVSDLNGIVGTVRQLLADPPRLAALADQARTGARHQADWATYVARVGETIEGLEKVPASPGSAAAGAIGDHVRQRDREERKHLTERARDLERLVARLEARVFEFEGEVTSLEQSAADHQRDSRGAHDLLRTTEARLEATQVALNEANGQVVAYRARLSARLVDRSGLGRLVRSFRSLRS